MHLLLTVVFFLPLILAQDYANTTYYEGFSESCLSALGLYLSPASPLFNCTFSGLNEASFASEGATAISNFKAYSDALCSSPPCDQSLLDQAASVLQKNCSVEITQGINSPAAFLYNSVLQYQSAISLTCVEDTRYNVNCVYKWFETLVNVNGSFGNVNIYPIYAKATEAEICTECSRAISILGQNIYQWNCSSAFCGPSYQELTAYKCGADFIKGSVSSVINQTWPYAQPAGAL